MDRQRIAIIGYGQIARTEHAPAILESPHFDLVAAVTSAENHGLSIPVYGSVATLLADADLGLDAVAICTPPTVRHAIARQCLEAGLHILLEKPTASTLGEALDIAAYSHQVERTAFATWHARAHPAVEEAARRIGEEGLSSLAIEWREDAAKWHPDQPWIWQAGGFGVFDPGINALSIAARLSPTPLLVRSAALTLHRDLQQPIEAALEFETAAASGPLIAVFDWRPGTPDCWRIRAMTHGGTRITLDNGGRKLAVDDTELQLFDPGEYPALYARFAELIAARRSDMDVEPLRIVADALLIAERAVGPSA